MGDVGSLALGGGDGRPRAAHQHDPAAADPRWPLRVRDAERDRAGGLVPRASTGACCAWRPIHHHFEVGGWPEFTVIVRFWLLAGAAASRSGSASSTPTSSTSPGCSTDAGPGGRPRRRPGASVVVVHARRRPRRHRARGPAAARRYRRRGYRARAAQAVAEGATVLEAPDADASPARTARPPTSSCRARACAPTIPRSSPRSPPGVPVRSEVDLAVERLRARDPTRRAWSRSPAPTARRRSPR